MGRTRRRRNQKNNKSVIQCLEHVELCRLLCRLGWNNQAELRICDFPETGKGLYSRRHIAIGDTIVRLPFEALISLKNIEEDQIFKQCFDEQALQELSKGEIQFQSMLAYYLSYLSLQEVDGGYRAYIYSLPKEFAVPYFCSKQEMAFLPDTVLKKMVDQNELIKKNYAKLESLARKDAKTDISLELFKWAYFVVNTRSVYLDSIYAKVFIKDKKCMFVEKLSDEPNMALAPLLDFLNHDSSAKTTSQLSVPYKTVERMLDKNHPVELFYELISEVPFPAYSQIFISYGVHNNAKLLTEYGFFLPDNQQDYLEISLDDINAFIKYDPELRPLKIHREKYCFIAEHHLEEQLFFVPGDVLSHNLAVCLTILFAEQNIYQLRMIAFGEIPSLDPIREIASRLINYKLKEYHTFCSGLSKLSDLSPSGRICHAYLDECIKFLNKIRAQL
ncbi:SET domain-containing protein 4 [Ochlerotatus camptorhynchus]|uniref:SET domain-containing protein 4 n=1 Tax=Ochlerotatus camptorhynchus TaxID=644619 RepID=UPI0031D693EA